MPSDWFRVYLRPAPGAFSEVRPRWRLVEGADALAKALRGAVWHYERAATLRCDHCERSGPFDHGWQSCPIWSGSRLETAAAGRELVTTCSDACWDALTGGYRGPEWLDLHEEPGRTPEQNSALWDARMRETEARRDKTAHRKVPMPKWPGDGYCKWCTRRVLNEKGQPTRRCWHDHCVTDYFLHSRGPEQFDFAAKRDGRRCFDCKTEARPLEVEHDVPLWKVRDLPDDERRRYYGPWNLRLRCDLCHKAKSAREARERAAQRAFVAAQTTLPL